MLLLVRHGQSEANVSGLLVGRLDSPLTVLGRRQAAALGSELAAHAQRTGKPPVRLISSPLGRALETADAIAAALRPGPSGASLPSGRQAATVGRLPIEVDERFVELDYGELDGLAPSELSPGIWDGWRADPKWRPPGGETLSEVDARVAAACQELAAAASGGDVVVVSHVSPIKAAVAWALGGGAELSWRLSLGVASITRISTSSPARALVSFNESTHLHSL